MVRYSLRLPKELHRQLKEISEKSDRSLHGQILFILKKWVAEYDNTESLH